MGDFKQVDEWIAKLMECKCLSESEVEMLCEKVRWSATCMMSARG